MLAWTMMVITFAWMLNYMQHVPVCWTPPQLCICPHTFQLPPTRKFSSGPWTIWRYRALVGPAQSKCPASVRDRCDVWLFDVHQIIWLSRHTKLIPSAGEKIYSLKLKSLPKGKVALIRNLYCSFTACNFSISFSKFCNSMSRKNRKGSWMKLSETMTQ